MIDERFLMHRLKSTSLAAVIGGISLGSWFLFEFYANGIERWDIFIIISLMALTKISAMIFYRFKN